MSNYKSWKLPASFITTTELADGTIVAADIADGTVSTSKFAATVAPTILGGTINNATIGATTPSSGVFNELSVTKTGDLSVEIGGSTSAQIDLKSPAGDDFDFRLRTAGTGAELDSGSGYTFKSAGVTKLQLDTTGNLISEGYQHAKTWQTVGVGTLAPEVVINGGTGSAEGAMVRFQKASADAAWIGIESTIIGGTGDSLLLKSKSGQAINFYPSGSYAGQFSSGGNFVANGSITGASLSVGAGAITAGTGSFTKASAGAAITFTNGGATPKAGYLYSDANYVGLFDSSGATGNGIYLSPATNNVYVNISNSVVGNFSSTGLAVTGGIQGAVDATSYTTKALYLSNAANTKAFNTYVNSSTGALVTSLYNGSSWVDNALILDAVGNLGIGTTAGANDDLLVYRSGTPSTEITILNVSGTGNQESIINFGDSTTGGGRYQGRISFHHASNAFKFSVDQAVTAAMTLDASGNLGIGKTPSSTLDVSGANKTNANEYGTITAFSTDSYAVDKGGSIAFWGKYNSSSHDACFGRIYGAKDNSTDGSFTGYLGFATSPGGAPTEKMRLSALGDLSIGASAPLAGANRLYVQSTSTYATSFWQTDTSFAGVVSTIGCATAAASGFTLLQCSSGVPYASSVVQFKVRGDGVLFAQNTAVQSLSDRSIKENIRDLEIGLSTINMLRPRRFDFIEGWGANKKNALGFIAQEVQEVLPELVTSEKFIDNSDAEHLTLGTTDLIPVLVKAIQELTAKNTALEARLSAAGL